MNDRDTVIPPTYPELEREIYHALEPVTERPTGLPPLGFDAASLDALAAELPA